MMDSTRYVDEALHQYQQYQQKYHQQKQKSFNYQYSVPVIPSNYYQQQQQQQQNVPRKETKASTYLSMARQTPSLPSDNNGNNSNLTSQLTQPIPKNSVPPTAPKNTQQPPRQQSQEDDDDAEVMSELMQVQQSSLSNAHQSKPSQQQQQSQQPQQQQQHSQSKQQGASFSPNILVDRSDSYSPNALEEMDDHCCEEIQAILGLTSSQTEFDDPNSMVSNSSNNGASLNQPPLDPFDDGDDDDNRMDGLAKSGSTRKMRAVSGLGLSQEDLLFDTFSPPARAHNPVVLDARFSLDHLSSLHVQTSSNNSSSTSSSSSTVGYSYSGYGRNGQGYGGLGGVGIFDLSPPLPEDDRCGLVLRQRTGSFDDLLVMPRL